MIIKINKTRLLIRVAKRPKNRLDILQINGCIVPDVWLQFRHIQITLLRGFYK